MSNDASMHSAQVDCCISAAAAADAARAALAAAEDAYRAASTAMGCINASDFPVPTEAWVRNYWNRQAA